MFVLADTLMHCSPPCLQCVDEGVSAMTHVLVGLEMLQRNRNPRHMEFSAHSLQTVCTPPLLFSYCSCGPDGSRRCWDDPWAFPNPSASHYVSIPSNITIAPSIAMFSIGWGLSDNLLIYVTWSFFFLLAENYSLWHSRPFGSFPHLYFSRCLLHPSPFGFFPPPLFLLIFICSCHCFSTLSILCFPCLLLSFLCSSASYSFLYSLPPCLWFLFPLLALTFFSYSTPVCLLSFIYFPFCLFPRQSYIHLFTFVSSSFAFSVFIHTSCVLPSLNVLLYFPLIYLPFPSFLFHPSPPPSPLSPTILLFTSFPTLSLISFPSQHFLLSFPTLNLLMSLRCLPSSFLFPSPPQFFLPSPFSCLLTSSWWPWRQNAAGRMLWLSCRCGASWLPSVTMPRTTAWCCTAARELCS